MTDEPATGSVPADAPAQPAEAPPAEATEPTGTVPETPSNDPPAESSGLPTTASGEPDPAVESVATEAPEKTLPDTPAKDEKPDVAPKKTKSSKAADIEAAKLEIFHREISVAQRERDVTLREQECDRREKVLATKESEDLLSGPMIDQDGHDLLEKLKQSGTPHNKLLAVKRAIERKRTTVEDFLDDCRAGGCPDGTIKKVLQFIAN